MRKLFKGMKFWIATGTKLVNHALTRGDVKNIIETLGGDIVIKPSKGHDTYCIALVSVKGDDTPPRREFTMKKEYDLISHEWIFDSISYFKVLDEKEYRIDYLEDDL
jgi:hypothetical protein